MLIALILYIFMGIICKNIIYVAWSKWVPFQNPVYTFVTFLRYQLYGQFLKGNGDEFLSAYNIGCLIVFQFFSVDEMCEVNYLTHSFFGRIPPLVGRSWIMGQLFSHGWHIREYMIGLSSFTSSLFCLNVTS